VVAIATMKEYLNDFSTGDDEASDLIKSIIALPADARLYQRHAMVRQWIYPQCTSYTQYLTFELRNTAAFGGDDELWLTVSGGWRTYDEAITAITRGIVVKLDDFRTSKEVLVALCNKFVERYQKPSSQGNVKVFYDESQVMWCWKRPTSDKICYDVNGVAYHAETCTSVQNILGSGVVPDERRFLSEPERRLISNGSHTEVTVIGGAFYFKAGLIPVYYNQVPFNAVARYVPASNTYLYEFVMVNGERLYIDLKKTENSLLAYPVHGYNTRIETLVPASKLFLRSKTDLYAKRDQAEVPFLGWELEACSNISAVGTAATATAFKEQLPWLVMCKNDGSISPEGFETVSVPATLDFWQDSNLSSALDSMRVAPYNMRSFEHSKCGFHVHVSRSALSVLDLQKMERFVHNPDNNDFITKIAGRKAGTYQKYSPELFNNRKKWSLAPPTNSSGRPTRPIRVEEEDILHFMPSWERIQENVGNYVQNVSESSSQPARFQNFGDYCTDFVSYDHMDRILRAHPDVQTRYPRLRIFSIGNFFSDLYSDAPRYAQDVTGITDDPDVGLNLIRYLFEQVICVGRPKFSWIVHQFFPEWDLTWEEIVVPEPPTAVPEPTTPAWKFEERKSKAPYRRKNSQLASQMIKGPVGKGVNQRYDALNTTNANTVEFRMFKGTMNGTTIMRYLEFVDALVRFVAFTSATNEGLHYSAFIRWLREDAFNIARYEHLVSFISENGFIDRKEIRRKTLPTVVSADKDVTGLVGTPAKGFKELTESKPIGSFTLATEVSEPETPAMSVDEVDELYDVNGSEYEGEYEGEYDYEEECSDPDCECRN
jgi:hypothetical protein